MPGPGQSNIDDENTSDEDSCTDDIPEPTEPGHDSSVDEDFSNEEEDITTDEDSIDMDDGFINEIDLDFCHPSH